MTSPDRTTSAHDDGISNDAFQELRMAARRDLARFVGPDGQVEFAAPALVATARLGR